MPRHPTTSMILLGPLLAWALVGCEALSSDQPPSTTGGTDRTAAPSDERATLRPLPSPDRVNGMALHEALDRRRSVRSFASTPLTEAELGQLLWAAQGVNRDDGRRTAPSAGATYPLELLVATADGLYRYDVADHALRSVTPGDVRSAIGEAALAQTWIADAPAVVVIAAEQERTAARYGARSERYVALEAGHAAQNLLLEAVALGLGAVPVGAFDDDRLSSVLGLERGEKPLYIVPVGRPAE